MKKKSVLYTSILIALALSACGQVSQPSSSLFSSEDTPSSISSEKESSSPSSSKESSSSEESSSSLEQSSSSEETSSSEASSSSEVSSSSLPISSSSESISSSSEPISSSSEEPIVDNYVNIEIFALNDVHGNVKDTSNGLGIGKTSTLLKTYPDNVNNAMYLSQGDMWQGSAESNKTKGKLVTEWMNQMNFTSMTVGNHEFDWSTSYVSSNSQLANFPFLGINVFDRTTNQRVNYLNPSVVINKNGAKIGIIGAIGDCYNSISASMVEDVYFKVGDELSTLVKQEATRLRSEEKCDFIIFSVHDGSDNYNYLDYGYDQSLSNGYVDLVLEGHTHRNYILTDDYGVYHIQCSANNKTINYINLTINTGRDTFVINKTKTIYTNDYVTLNADSSAEALFTKYASEIGDVNSVLGYNAYYRNSDELEDLVATLYLQYGLEKWGTQYNIFLGGGYLKTRSPYDLDAGDVTYAMLSSLFPFDNNLVLCSISGYNLHYKFVHTTNSDYHVSYSSYGEANSGYITFADTYYVVCDTYTSDYASNNLTVIDTYEASGFYAKDMLANYASSGGFMN